MKPLKIIFAGTPKFAQTHLQALVEHNHNIIAVYTQRDKPAGRGRKSKPTEVKQYATSKQIPVYQPKTLKDTLAVAELKALEPDIIVVVAYGMILPQTVLTIPKLGCINVHASLLPRWRGAAPIHRAIEAGDNTTGITIMQMDAGLDTGDMLLKSACNIEANDTTLSLQAKLAEIGSKLLIEALDKIAAGTITQQQQDEALVTYAHKIAKTEAAVDCSLSALALERKLRAFTPQPKLTIIIDDITIKICTAHAIAEATITADFGTILAADKNGIDLACNQSILRITHLQLPGGKVLSAQDVLNGNKDLFVVGNQIAKNL